MCVGIYKNHSESVPELIGKSNNPNLKLLKTHWYHIECFKDKFTDPDDKVRATACKILGEIGIGNDSQTMNKDLVELVGARAKDKKVPNLIIIYNNIILIISV